jgi:hypothetical protein
MNNNYLKVKVNNLYGGTTAPSLVPKKKAFVSYNNILLKTAKSMTVNPLLPGKFGGVIQITIGGELLYYKCYYEGDTFKTLLLSPTDNQIKKIKKFFELNNVLDYEHTKANMKLGRTIIKPINRDYMQSAFDLTPTDENKIVPYDHLYALCFDHLEGGKLLKKYDEVIKKKASADIVAQISKQKFNKIMGKDKKFTFFGFYNHTTKASDMPKKIETASVSTVHVVYYDSSDLISKLKLGDFVSGSDESIVKFNKTNKKNYFSIGIERELKKILYDNKVQVSFEPSIFDRYYGKHDPMNHEHFGFMMF